MKRGRKRKPSNLLAFTGNPGKRPLPKDEPKPEAELPTPPPHLDAGARREWKRLGAQLLKLGLVSQIDRALLAAYCVAYSRWAEAERQLRKTGLVFQATSGFPIQNPYLPIANKAMEQLRKIAVEFGLSPSSRTSVKAAPKTPANKPERFFD